MQVGIPYELVGPDGSRAVFNDTTDVDFVGYLDPDNGITGLLDTADLTQSTTNHVEADGQAQGNSFFQGRVGTLQGFVYPTDRVTTSVMEQKIKKASRAMRVAAVPSSQMPVGASQLRWTPDGGARRRLFLYRQGKVTITDRRPKKFLIPMSSPLPYVYSDALNSLVITPAGGSGDAGFTNPMRNPITTAYQQTGATVVANAGDVETWPLIVIQGPVTNPTIRNATTGLQWTLTTTLSSTDSIAVDTQLRTVVLNGAVSRYGVYAANFSINRWWSLAPGANDVRFLPSSYSTGAQMTIYWRDAWE